MATPLPRLRTDLDFMPSPLSDRPGLCIRDPFRYSDATIIVPPFLVQALPLFDGQQTDLDLQAHLSRLAGELIGSEVVRSLMDSLSQYGFLHDPEFEKMKESKQRAFRQAAERTAMHAGSAYPDQEAGLRQWFTQFSADGAAAAGPAPAGELLGLAAPHVSPEGGRQSYAAAYEGIGQEQAEKTFVILGTSHYGAPEKFGLTRKPFRTPLGALPVDTALVDWLCDRGGSAVQIEDYCHSMEHSIEFQCLFLQHRLVPGIRILPILCGPLAESLVTGRPPETNDAVRRFYEALGELAAREGRRLFWILGIDLAHIGRRYGDPSAVRAEQGPMAQVRHADGERLERVCAGDSEGFFELVRPGHDELRWCGYSPLYTFLQVVPAARGRVLHYEQWNIDDASVVSFAGVEFRG